MPNPPTQKGIEHNSLPLPPSWAETIELKGYWERKDAEEREQRQLTPCERDEEPEPTWPALHYSEEEWAVADAVGEEPDELEQDWLPGYDITDDG